MLPGSSASMWASSGMPSRPTSFPSSAASTSRILPPAIPSTGGCGRTTLAASRRCRWGRVSAAARCRARRSIILPRQLPGLDQVAIRLAGGILFSAGFVPGFLDQRLGTGLHLPLDQHLELLVVEMLVKGLAEIVQPV